ncbi:MAG: tetratricopeptide repeat protein [Betaproteobacteria bacterium]
MSRALVFLILGALMIAIRSASAAPTAFAAELDERWDYAAPDVSEQRLRQERARWPADSPQALEIETQIARAQGLQRRFGDATATLAGVEARLDGMPSHVRVRYLLERGRLFNSSGAPREAVPLFAAALELAECEGDAFYAIDAAHMLGLAGPAAERFDWNLKAIAMTERAPDERSKRWLASLYNNVGWTYDERGESARALDYFRRALAAWETRGGDDNIRVARWAVGHGLRRTGELDAAERIQTALRTEYERNGTVDGYVFEELAEVHLARGQVADARPWFAKAYAALRNDASLQADAPARLQRLADLGGVAATHAREAR